MATPTQKPKNVTRKPPSVNRSTSLNETLDKFTLRRPTRAQLSPEETRTRMEAFAREREEGFIAAIREDED